MPKQQPQNEDRDPFFDVALPEDGKEVLGDVNGYWDPDKSAIRFKPVSVKIFDNKIQSERPSVLIVGVLTAPGLLYSSEKGEDDDEAEREYKKMPVGTAVGVFYKPGLKGLIRRCGVDCYIKQKPEKDWIQTKKGVNKMKTYELVAGDETMMIPISDDFRKDSAGVLTPFDPKPVGKQSKSQDESYDDAF